MKESDIPNKRSLIVYVKYALYRDEETHHHTISKFLAVKHDKVCELDLHIVNSHLAFYQGRILKLLEKMNPDVTISEDGELIMPDKN